MDTRLDIQKIRKDFPVLNREVHGKPLVYLDSAATTLKPKAVNDAVAWYDSVATANIHRAVHLLSEESTAAYEGARNKVKVFLDAADRSQIIFTTGTTQGINLVAQSYGRKFLKEGDEILISHMEHHSNIVPWQMLCEEKGCVLKVAPIDDDGQIIMSEFKALISDNTRFISVVYVSNSLGTINPVQEIIALARERSIPVLLDAAQAVAHMEISVQKLDVDFLVFSGHKLFSPTGIGVLYGKKPLLEAMPPFMGGGDMIRSVTFEKTTFAPLPAKFEAGTPPIAAAIGLGAGIDYVTALGLKNIQAYEEELLAYGTAVLEKIPGLRLIGKAKAKASVLSFVVEGIHPHDLGSLLDQEGVAIRTGHHCTQPVMARYSVPATARASMSFYNTKEDIDKLAAALYKAKELFE